MEPSAASTPVATPVDAVPEFSPGTRVVQIGAPQTGIAAVQWAMHRARAELREQGVHYTGDRDQANRPALALVGETGRRGGPPVRESWWTDFVDEVSAAGEMMTVASSEAFSNAQRDGIERLVDDLGRSRLQVVRLARRYDKLMPAQWQQSLNGGRRQRLEPWAGTVLADPGHHFWDVQRADTLTRRWAEVVGPERMTVVFVDEEDEAWPGRVIERMLGVRAHTLDMTEEMPNRPLLRGEAELVRLVSGTFHRMQWGDRAYTVYLRNGVARPLRQRPPDPADRPIRLSPGKAEQLAAHTARDLEVLDSLGVRVVGDPAWLTPEPAAGEDDAPLSVSVETVTSAAAAAVTRARTDGGFALEGRWPAEFFGPGEQSSALPEGGDAVVDAVVARLEADGHPAQVVDRYRTGVLGGLRTLSAEPELFLKQAGADSRDIADGRVAPLVGAAAVVGAIAAADGRLYV